MGYCNDCPFHSCLDCGIYQQGLRDRPIKTISCLQGTPSCPDCGTVLVLRPMPHWDKVRDKIESRWYCPNESCNDQWETGDLIEAINNNIVQEIANEG